MGRAQQTAPDLNVALRDFERRLAVVEARQGIHVTSMADGIIRDGLQTIDFDSGAHGSPALCDWTLTGLSTDDTRDYLITMHSQLLCAGSSTATFWICDMLDNGAAYDRMFSQGVHFAGSFTTGISANLLWRPTTGLHDLAFTVTRPAGTGTLQFQAGANALRFLLVEDIGLRTYPPMESEDDLP